MRPHQKLFFVLWLALMATGSFGQSRSIALQADSLKYAGGDPFECSSVTWRIIAAKKEAIQVLIDKLDDTTSTRAADHCKKTALRVGDLAYLTLTRIMALPFFAVTGKQLDVIEAGGCQRGLFEYIEANRARFKAQVQTYYDKKKDHLTWRQSDSNHLPPCEIHHRINGRYE